MALSMNQIKRQIDEQKAKQNKLTPVVPQVKKPVVTPAFPLKPLKPVWNESKVQLKPAEQTALANRNLEATKRLVSNKPGAFAYGVAKGAVAPGEALQRLAGIAETADEKAVRMIADSQKLTAQMDASKGMGDPNIIKGQEVSAYGAGKMVGSVLPFVGVESVAGAGLAKLAPKLTGLALTGAKGAISGGGILGLEAAGEGKRGKELLGATVGGALMGAGGNIAFGYIGKALQKIKAGTPVAEAVAEIAEASQKAPEVRTTIQQELGLPEGSTWADVQRKLEQEDAVDALYKQYETYKAPEQPVVNKNKTTQYTTEDINPAYIEPPHNVRDSEKLDSLIQSMSEKGWEGRPILVISSGDQNIALTGSHRINAAKEADIDIPVVKIEEPTPDEMADKSDDVVYAWDTLFNHAKDDDSIELALKELEDLGEINSEPRKLIREEIDSNDLEYVTKPNAPNIERELFPQTMRQPSKGPTLPEPALITANRRAQETLQPIVNERLPVTGTPVVSGRPERFASLDMNLPRTVNIPVNMPTPPIQGPPIPRQGGAEIIYDAVAPKKTFRRKIEEIRNAVEDDLLDFARLEKRATGKVASAEKSLYKTARLYKGAPEEANRIVEMELAPIVDSAKSAGYTQKELSEYALMKHAEDVNAAGIESGFSDAEIRAVVDKYAGTPLESERMKLMGISDNLIENLKNDGVISQAQVDAMRAKWPNYMPLFRHFDDEKVDFSQGLGQTFSNVASPIKALKGSGRDVIDPLESMVKNIYKSVDAGARNRVGLQLHALAENNPTVNGIPLIRRLEPGETVGRKNVVNVKVNGEKIAYEVEPEVFSVFNNLDKESANGIVNWFSKAASVLRAGATLTPEFAIRNPLRDIVNAYNVSSSGFNPFTDFPAGIAAAFKKDQLYKDFISNNAGYGNIMSMDRQTQRDVLSNALKKPIMGKFVNVINPKAWLATMRMISDVTENATKIGEFRAATRSGATPQEAAFRARDLMDFARAGHSVRPANRMVAFMNANIQGKSKLIRAISENPAKVTAKIATSMVFPTVCLVAFREKYASDEQKQTIKDAPDWLKNSFFLIPIHGTDMIARFPKPFDISVAANTTERFLDYMSERDPEAFKGFVKSTVNDQAIPMMITGMLPFIEGAMNYSNFRQGPIISRSDQTVEKKYQFDSKTSHLARAMAEMIEKNPLAGENSNFASPRVMDYVIRSSTGGVGSYALDATDWIYDKATGEKMQKPTPTLEQRPVVKAFLVNPRTSGKSTEYVYDMKEKLQNKKNSEKRGAPPLTQKEKIALGVAKDYAGQLSDYSTAIKKIEEDKNMTADEKQRQIVSLTKERNEISRKGAELIKRATEVNVLK